MDDELLRDLDWLVVRCEFDNRAEAIRTALVEFARHERQREAGEQIAAGYRRIPQTEEEIGLAGSRGFPGLPDDEWDDVDFSEWGNA